MEKNEENLKIKKILALMCYYSFARFLPASRFIISKKIRGMLCGVIFKKCGKNVNIEKGAYFGLGSSIEIGDNSGIGTNCRIFGPISIGRDVIMAPDVVILTKNHKYDRLDIPMCLQGDTEIKPVIIKDDVWIGIRSIILPGVEISKGVIIGAGSVVTKNIPEYAIVGGSPAKIIKFRYDKK
jgi:maltose O-acetyltransferase